MQVQVLSARPAQARNPSGLYPVERVIGHMWDHSPPGLHSNNREEIIDLALWKDRDIGIVPTGVSTSRYRNWIM